MDKPETEFRAWRRRLNIKSQADAARMIGRSRRQIAAYEAGAEIPRVVRLAMLAIEECPYSAFDVRISGGDGHYGPISQRPCDE